MTSENYDLPDPPPNRLEEILDGILGLLIVAGTVVGGTLLTRGVSINQLLFVELGGIDWEWVWELIKTLGLGAGITRFIVWLWRKFGGDKYAVTIWMVLDTAAPNGLSRNDLKDKVREIVKERNEKKFAKKYQKAWKRLRSSGEIVVVEDNGQSVVKLGVDK